MRSLPELPQVSWESGKEDGVWDDQKGNDQRNHTGQRQNQHLIPLPTHEKNVGLDSG